MSMAARCDDKDPRSPGLSKCTHFESPPVAKLVAVTEPMVEKNPGLTLLVNWSDLGSETDWLSPGKTLESDLNSVKPDRKRQT